jgi:hypothetical protein
MAQITSRTQLDEWLKDKPADWAQVIAARAALRVLPYAFAKDVPQKWVKDVASPLFRASAISWAARNFPTHDMAVAADAARFGIRLVADASRVASLAADDTVSLVAYAANASLAASAVANAARAAARLVADCAVYAARVVDASLAADAATWANISHDCDWLASEGDAAFASRLLTRKPLWPADEPKGWREAWGYAIGRLAALNEGDSVWIDWYNRRIEGHDAAFDIPGDIARTHDKAILARLADATDEDFWGKEATYVNTTLQRWIDEARLTAELESIVRKLEAGAATQFGSPQARETLAAFRAKIEAALANQPPAHAPIGHNHPPEGINPAEVPILPPAIREEAKTMLVTLDQSTPNALVVAKTLTRWSRLKSTFQHDEFSKNFSGELGTSAARGIVFILTTLCLLGLAWLKAILRI